ncbi:helix-turn-helix domain-containing protein [Streptomyces sp. SID3343]|uniref:helix-turn-helix domain-containing protein n=1 Tax=Streptomyces sp. SID3343 TaxID=2690260 RepID=UPI00136DF33B|nr:helix-turn-helix domain-containing protein [Streptomyces sp. SID3343]
MRTRKKLPDVLWTAEETAAYLGVEVTTLYAWRYKNEGPAAYKIGRWLRFDPEDIRVWLGGRVAA